MDEGPAQGYGHGSGPSALFISIYLIGKDLGLSFSNIVPFIHDSEYSKIFFWEGNQHFIRRFLAGAFIAIAMTGRPR